VEQPFEHQPTQEAQLDADSTAALAHAAQACVACELASIACADACLHEEDVSHLGRCIRLDLDCADICAATARLLSRGHDLSSRGHDNDAKLLRALVEACARACATCATECELYAERHEHCRVCATLCRSCAEQCGRVLRLLPDTYGNTHPPEPARGGEH
jgi:hypothetical protein